MRVLPQAFLLASAFSFVCLAAPYRSPLAVTVSPNGRTLYVSDHTAGCVTHLDATSGTILGETALFAQPQGIALSADGKTLYVAERKAHTIARIDTAHRNVVGRIPIGAWPGALVLAEKAGRAYVCNRGDHSVSVVELATGSRLHEIKVGREPAFAAITSDESRIVVANFLPDGAGTDADLAADLSILDTQAMREIARVKLPPGSTALAGVWASPDGMWAYAVHALGRFQFPITKLEEGWVHAFALSIFDLRRNKRLATVLLDSLTLGAADPWAVLGSSDGNTVWVSHRGAHEISILNISLLHELLSGKVPQEIADRKEGGRDNIWVRIQKDKGQIDQLGSDLSALPLAGVIRRTYSGGQGPMGLALSPDGRRLYVANYYSGSIAVLNAFQGDILSVFPIGKQPPADAIRRGEIYFHDATRCYQHWHSCATCHLDGGRVDGLPWDFPRDGIDNAKDVISLVNLLHTEPYNRLATRATARFCMESGVMVSHQVTPAPKEVEDLLAYVGSLTAEGNPNLPTFIDAAKRGKVLFDGKAECSRCHSGPYFTDQKAHDVGILSPNEPGARYDTPSLIEVYRTAPYFHDGRAVTVRDALTTHDSNGRHGNLRALTPIELDDLIAYVLSL